MKRIELFMAMRIPTVTHQEHKVSVKNGKPHFYEPPELREARAKFKSYLAQHVPEARLDGPIRLLTKWEFAGAPGWKVTKPDTENMIKLLKDCMTAVGFWKDDCQVASEITEKFYGPVEGIYEKVEEL